MKKFGFVMLLILLFPISGSADSGHIVINEIQIGQSGSGNANNEFVQIYNPTSSDIDLSELGLKIHIRNSNGTDNNKTLTFKNKVIHLKGFFLIAPNNDYGSSIGADATYSVTSGNKLVDNGGVYISTSTTANTSVIDKVGWGSQPEGGYEGMPYEPSIPVGQSIERVNGQDTDNNKNDFFIEGQDMVNDEEPQINNAGDLGGIYVNEIMPDPKSPKSDITDEWIELYNENDFRVDLSGAILKDTVGVVHEYVIPDGISIDPGRFAIFYSSATKITLNNTGDSVELLNREKSKISETDNYGKAKEGYSFALFSEGWDWTESATPLAENRYTVSEKGGDGSSNATSAKKPKSPKTSKENSKSAKSKSKAGKTAVKGSKDLNNGGDLGGGSGKSKVIGNKLLGQILLLFSAALAAGYIIFRKRIYEYFEQKS